MQSFLDSREGLICRVNKSEAACKICENKSEDSHKSVAITTPLQAAALNENATFGHPHPISQVESPSLMHITLARVLMTVQGRASVPSPSVPTLFVKCFVT